MTVKKFIKKLKKIKNKNLTVWFIDDYSDESLWLDKFEFIEDIENKNLDIKATWG